MKRSQFCTMMLAAACAFAQTPPTPAPKTPPKTAAGTPAANATPPREPGLYAILNTSMGTITLRLYEKETPGVVKNFVALAQGRKAWKDPKTGQMVTKPIYNNITFHRVIPDFMIQTGDPTGTGMHDCGFTVKDEIVPSLVYDKPGKLGLARTSAPNSGACQFFITDAAYPSLNGQYTLFGEVVDGQDVVHKIANVPRDGSDKPRTPVTLKSVTIKREGPPAAAPAGAKKTGTGTATKKTGTTTTPTPKK